MIVLKLAVLAFGVWFIYGHLRDALTDGRAALRGATYTLAQPWRFSLALGANLALGSLLILSVTAPSAAFSIVPSALRSVSGDLDWFAALLILFIAFAALVRAVIFFGRR
jgi:hypothetical protein